MLEINNRHFSQLLTYCESKNLDSYEQHHALLELDDYINCANNMIYNNINYEHLIYLEVRFKANEEIQQKIGTLKNIICKNYILKDKLLNRLGAYD